MKKIIFNCLALLFFVIALLGSFLPVLPTVPFLLLSAFFASSGSERIHNKITKTKLYQKHLADFVDKKEMTLDTKIKIMSFASIMLGFGFYFSKVRWARIIIMIVWLVKMIYFIFFIETKERACEIVYDR